MDNYFSATLNKSPDWFWDWVDHSCSGHADELLQWLNTATEDELIDFYRVYWGEIVSGLIASYDAVCFAGPNEYCLSEDAMKDFNGWIIVQGKELWQAACAEAAKRDAARDRHEPYDENIWTELHKIYKQTEKQAKNMEVPPAAHWNGVTWLPRDHYFAGEGADMIYYDRFGGELADKI